MTNPAWLFMGPEIGEKNTAVEAVIKTISTQYGDVETHTVYAGDTGMGDIISLLQNASLFSSAKLLILKSAELIKKKEDIDLLTDWIQSVSKKENANSSFLILISDEISIAKKISGTIPKTQQKIFWELFENKKQEWVRSFLFKEGIEIEDEAVDELLELVENNTDALKTACSHLVIYFKKGAHLVQEDIEKLFAHNKEESAFTLFNALTLGELETALSINQKIILSKNSSLVQTIAGLTYCFRRLQDWHKIHRENEYLDDFALKRFGFSGKTTLTQYRRAAKMWNEIQCVKIIALLSQTDLDLRSLGSNIQSIVMEICLYEIICKSGKKIELYSFEHF